MLKSDLTKKLNHWFIKWKYAIVKCTSHSNTGYHKFYIQTANNFSKVVSGKMDDVAAQSNSQRKQQCEENRSTFRSIIETIIFCVE